MIPWKSDLVDVSVFEDFEKMSAYTKQIINFDARNDDQIRYLFGNLRNKFASMKTHNWVNLFDALVNKFVDLAPQGQNPGIRSHVIISNQVRSFLHKGLL
jgi:hypothetical protein